MKMIINIILVVLLLKITINSKFSIWILIDSITVDLKAHNDFFESTLTLSSNKSTCYVITAIFNEFNEGIEVFIDVYSGDLIGGYAFRKLII